MKNLICIAIVLFGCTISVFAQESSQIAITQTAQELVNSKRTGDYSFQLPTSVSQETATSNAKYYTHYFTVTFDNDSHTAKLKMLQNGPKDRFVMVRYLTSCGVKYVKVGSEILKLDEFANDHLN